MTKRTLLISIGAVAGLALSFVVGVRVGVVVGVDQFVKMDASAKASVLTSELRGLRAGNVAKIIETKEIEVDGDVVRAIEFQQSGMPWLFWPENRFWNHARSLGYVAQYRKEYPPVVPTIAPAQGSPDPGDLRGFAQDVERSTKILIERYGR